MFKKIIKKIIPSILHGKFRKILNYYFDGFSVRSYSQEGEDLILNRFFDNEKIGFYVDVGAHHPMRFSNTYLFYKKGWSGINIDAMPGSMSIFNNYRHRDINIELPISDENKTLTYYAFDEPAFNGFSEELSLIRDGHQGCRIIFKKKMETKTLAHVLDEYLPKGQNIDFLTIDVEGLDFSVLLSNDWVKFSPKIVLVEILEERLENINSSEIAVYMKSKGYFVFAKTFNTVFFCLENNFVKGVGIN